jgi:hypothetical protein
MSPNEQDAAFDDKGCKIACFIHSLQLMVRGGLDKASMHFALQWGRFVN